jgi:hypothetical protein
MTDARESRQRRSNANRGFVAVIVLSLLIHGSAIAGVLYNQHRRPSVIDVPNAIPVQLVKLGKKRDEKLLPRIQREAPAVVEEQGIALDTKNETPPDASKQKTKTKTSEKKLSDAARRLLEGNNSKLEEALEKIEEAEGDPEGDPNGTTSDNTNAAAGYQRAIIKTLQSNYRLPETIPAGQRAFLKAQVLLFIERDGSIAKFEFVEKHPNDIFMGALEAMLKQVKLPPPPTSEAKAFSENGVLVIFRP